MTWVWATVAALGAWLWADPSTAEERPPLMAGRNLPSHDTIVRTAALLVTGAVVGYVALGSLVPSLTLTGVLATLPPALRRSRERDARDRADGAWPVVIEGIRLRACGLGRSVPQSLFDAGLDGPEELRRAFALAQREWHLTTDFPRSAAVLKDELASATADAVLETLIVCHEVGGADLERRLRALAADRRDDRRAREEARSRQAGARYARSFVLLVPVAMAAAGAAIGSGHEVYATAHGQAVAATAALATIGCWWWSGRLLRLPDPPRLFP